MDTGGSRSRRALVLALAAVLAGGCAGGSPTPTSQRSTAATPAATSTAAPTQAATAAPTIPATSAPSPTLPVVVVPTPGADGTIYLAAAVPRAATSAADATSAAGAINAFAVDLYGRVAEKGRNLVVSPASIAIALSMARAGARGETATQMDAVLRDVASEANASWINALDLALSKRSGTFTDQEGTAHDVTLRIANTSFAQADYPIEEAYLDAIAARFGSGIRLVDYRADPEAARSVINGWVSSQTEKRIPQLLASGDVSEATRLALVNAIYLKAPWAMPFESDQTEPGAFTREDGSTISVPMMHDVRVPGSLVSGTGTGWRAAELPYIGDQLAMTIIVPDDIARFEAAMTPQLLDEIVSGLEAGPGEIWLPKFGIETKARLADVLAAMGMPLAFDPAAADFTGIANPAVTGEPGLFISKVVHQANIDVDEKGTEAAAATAVVMDTGGGPTDWVRFRVDRPFVFLLRDVPTGATLFIGRVMDPSMR